MTASLAHRATIQQLVAVYQEQCERVRKAFAELADAERALDAAFLTRGGFRIDPSYEGRSADWDKPERALARLRDMAWRCIVGRLELRRIMSSKRWDELCDAIDKGKLPEITVENVEAVCSQWAGSIPDMWTEAVREVFEYLRPRNSALKTNSELEVPRKIIRQNIVSMHLDYPITPSVSYYHRQYIASVERVFRGLDGKGQTLGYYTSELEQALEASAKAYKATGVATDAETEYFRVRVYGNGNAHIWFKRLDLLAKLNAIAGGKRLRPARVA